MHFKGFMTQYWEDLQPNRSLSSTKLNNRDPGFDTARFLLILAIYIGHFAAPGRLYPFLMQTHVPLFFLLSGFWAMKRVKKSTGAYILDSLKRYILPWALWAVFYTGVYSLLSSSLPLQQRLLQFFLAIRGNGVLGTWFIPSFFFVSVAAQIIMRIAHRLKIYTEAIPSLLSIVALVLFIVFEYLFPIPQKLIFTFHQFHYFFLYYSLGSVFGQIYIKFAKIKWATLCAHWAVAISLIYLAVVYYGLDNSLWAFLAAAFPSPTHFMRSIILLVSSWFVLYYVSRVISSRWMAFLGKNTLILCLSELCIREIFTRILGVFGIIEYTQLQSIIFSLVMLIIAAVSFVPVTQYFSHCILILFQRVKHPPMNSADL